MGSSGQRRRKGNKHPQHLPKVGSQSDQHAERRAVLDEMGMRNAPPWIRTTTGIIVVALFAFAILGLLLLVFFR